MATAVTSGRQLASLGNSVRRGSGACSSCSRARSDLLPEKRREKIACHAHRSTPPARYIGDEGRHVQAPCLLL